MDKHALHEGILLTVGGNVYLQDDVQAHLLFHIPLMDDIIIFFGGTWITGSLGFDKQLQRPTFLYKGWDHPIGITPERKVRVPLESIVDEEIQHYRTLAISLLEDQRIILEAIQKYIHQVPRIWIQVLKQNIADAEAVLQLEGTSLFNTLPLSDAMDQRSVPQLIIGLQKSIRIAQQFYVELTKREPGVANAFEETFLIQQSIQTFLSRQKETQGQEGFAYYLEKNESSSLTGY